MRPQLLLIATALWMGIVELAAQAPADDPNLINITTLEQLDAIRYDLNGNGRADAPADVDKYNGSGAPFTVAQTTCSPDLCRGYELRNDLDFNDTDAVMPGNQLSIWAENAVSTSVTNAVTGGWVPIRDNYSNSFLATFEGNGQKISNLYINTSTLSDVGLFGKVGSDGEIRNLGLEGGSVTSTSSNASVGGLVGFNNSGTISACYATGDISGGENANVGGLVGQDYSGTISACYATGGVTGGDDANVGGLVGRNGGTISACYATGDVTGGDNANVGGLVGDDYGIISACYATGDVTGGNDASVGGLVGFNYSGTISACYATGDISGGGSANVGGLVGQNSRRNAIGTISACYATGTVRGGNDASVGGLVGRNAIGTISACYATGTVRGGNDASVGGLVGRNAIGTISACYATRDVTGGDNANVGGLVGINRGQISACYATGDVTGGDDANVGGLVGGSGGTLRHSYFDHSISNRPDTDIGAQTTAELQSLGPTGIYAQWSVDVDGNTTTQADQVAWNFCGNDQYPVLRIDANGDGQATADEFNNSCGALPGSGTPGGGNSSSPVAIRSMSPSSGPVGTGVILTGRGFSMIPTKNRVIFHGVADLSTDDVAVRTLVPVSDTKMAIIVPEGAISGRIRLTVEGETATSSEDFTVSSDGSTSDVAVFGVSELGDEKLGVYPNPAAEVIRFRGLSAGSSYNYALYSLGGSKVLAGSLDRETIDIGALSAGQYILVLQDDYLAEVLREAILIE